MERAPRECELLIVVKNKIKNMGFLTEEMRYGFWKMTINCVRKNQIKIRS